MKNERQYFWDLATEAQHQELSIEAQSEFSELLLDIRNKNQLKEIKRIRSAYDELVELKSFSKNESWEYIERKIHYQKQKWLRVVLKYAALIFIVTSLSYLANNISILKPYTPLITEINAPLGQMSEIKLSDGTKIWLNSGSKLTYSNNFGKDSRNVSLIGEGFFQVTKNEDIPFKVKTKNIEVEVLGTSFNVTSFIEEAYSEITLVEGEVQINNKRGKKIAQLKPNQQIHISEGDGTAIISPANTEFYTSWINGKIVFKEETLEEIAIKIGRWYNVEVRFNSEEIKGYQFSGTILKNKPLGQIIGAFEVILPIKMELIYRENAKNELIITKI